MEVTDVDLAGNGKIRSWNVGVNGELEKRLSSSELYVQVGWPNTIHCFQFQFAIAIRESSFNMTREGG